MLLNLLTAIVALAVWVIFTFVRPVGIGAVHLFLAIGMVFLVRWWALADGARDPKSPAAKAPSGSTARPK